MTNKPTNLTPTEERALIAMAFDEPEFFSFLLPKIKVDYFELDECKFVFTILKWHYDKHGTLPSKALTRDTARKHLTVDDPGYEEVLDLFNYNIDPRDYTIIKDNIVKWLQTKAYGLLYSDEGIAAYSVGDYDKIHDLVEQAAQIQDIGQDGLWFFDDLDCLFTENYEVKYTTGFSGLDPCINDGGPTKGDVLVWMAPTGVGKCHAHTDVIISDLSNIYVIDLEGDDGETKQIALVGNREVKTTRGRVKVCDLTEEDDIIEIPAEDDPWDLSLQNMRV